MDLEVLDALAGAGHHRRVDADGLGDHVAEVLEPSRGRGPHRLVAQLAGDLPPRGRQHLGVGQQAVQGPAQRGAGRVVAGDEEADDGVADRVVAGRQCGVDLRAQQVRDGVGRLRRRRHPGAPAGDLGVHGPVDAAQRAAQPQPAEAGRVPHQQRQHGRAVQDRVQLFQGGVEGVALAGQDAGADERVDRRQPQRVPQFRVGVHRRARRPGGEAGPCPVEHAVRVGVHVLAVEQRAQQLTHALVLGVRQGDQGGVAGDGLEPAVGELEVLRVAEHQFVRLGAEEEGPAQGPGADRRDGAVGAVQVADPGRHRVPEAAQCRRHLARRPRARDARAPAAGRGHRLVEM